MDYILPILPPELYGGSADDTDINKQNIGDAQQTLFADEINMITKDLYNSIMSDELPKSLQQDHIFADIIAEDFEQLYNILAKYIISKNSTLKFNSVFPTKINMSTSNINFYEKYVQLMNTYIITVKEILDEYNEIITDNNLKTYYLRQALVIYAYNLDDQPSEEE